MPGRATDAVAFARHFAATPGLLHRQLVGQDLDGDAVRATYNDRLDGILETTFLTDQVSAVMEGFHLGPLSAIALVASPRRSERKAARIASDRFDAIGVQYAVSGRACGDAAGRAVTSDPGTVMILDYGQPFRITDAEPREVLNISVPRVMFPVADGTVADRHGMVLSSHGGAMLASFMAALARDHRSYPLESGPMLARIFLDLLALSQNSFPSDDIGVLPGKHAQTVRRAERLVDARIGSAEIGPDWLASKLSLSRSELYASFQSFGGVARFIMLRRLAAAHTALSDPRDSRRIGEISYACGFSSDAHFARSFRSQYGVTAGSVRRAALAV
ncbi:MAG: helix-turn-helix domain-containing protein [Pseudomonadota bacterium]